MNTKNRYNDLKHKPVCLLILMAIFFCNSACSRSSKNEDASKSTINSNSKIEKTGNLKMSHPVLTQSLANINPKLFSSSEELEEAVYAELPMSNEEGIALRLSTPINIEEYKNASLIVLIGMGSETNLKTPLAENARIVWRNQQTKKTSEVLLFREARHKIPMPEDQMPPPPLNSVESEHSFTVEIIDIRERLQIEWIPSQYTIQVIVGDMISNTIEFELLARTN